MNTIEMLIRMQRQSLLGNGRQKQKEFTPEGIDSSLSRKGLFGGELHRKRSPANKCQ